MKDSLLWIVRALAVGLNGICLLVCGVIFGVVAIICAPFAYLCDRVFNHPHHEPNN